MSDIGSPLYIFFYKGCLMMYLVVWNFHDRRMLSCGLQNGLLRFSLYAKISSQFDAQQPSHKNRHRQSFCTTDSGTFCNSEFSRLEYWFKSLISFSRK